MHLRLLSFCSKSLISALILSIALPPHVVLATVSNDPTALEATLTEDSKGETLSESTSASAQTGAEERAEATADPTGLSETQLLEVCQVAECEPAALQKELNRTPREKKKTNLKRIRGRKYFHAHQPEVLREVFELQMKMEAKLTAQDREKLQNFSALSKQGQIDFLTTLRTDPDDVGEAEVNVIDGEYFVRVVHRHTGISFAFMDPTRFDQSSPGYLKWLARQHFDARDIGRDVVILTTDSLGRTSTGEYLPKPRFHEARFWQEWWRATWMKPKKRDIVLAVFNTALQVGITFGLAKIGNWNHPEMQGVYQNIVWGMAIGTFVDAYKRFTNRGTETAQIAKNSISSVSYVYTYSVMTAAAFHALHIRNLADVGPFLAAVAGIILASDHVQNFANVYLSNLVKVKWNQDLKDMERARITTVELKKKPFFIGKNEENLKWNLILNQLLALTVSLIPRQIDLLQRSLGSNYQIPLPHDIHLGVGKALMLGTILAAPLASAQLWKYLRKKYPDRPEVQKLADESIARWEDMKKAGPIKRAAQKVWKAPGKFVKWVQNVDPNDVKESCRDLLDRPSSKPFELDPKLMRRVQEEIDAGIWESVKAQ